MLAFKFPRVWRWVRFCSTEIVKKDTYIQKLRNGFQQDESKQLVVPAFKKAMLFPDKIAIKDSTGEYTFFQLYMSAKKLSIQISNICGSASHSFVAFFSSNNALWLIIQWACWMSGQVAVPMEPANPLEQLKQTLKNCKPALVISTPENEIMSKSVTENLVCALLTLEHSFVPSAEAVASAFSKQIITTEGCILTESTLPNEFYATANAMLAHTVGTPDGQKSVMLTYKNIDAQMKNVTQAWQLNAMDSMLLFIPMNRVQFVANAILCVGGNVIMQSQFDGHNAWSTLLGIKNTSKQHINMLLGTPIIYKRLIAEYDKIFAKDSRMVEYIVNHCKTKFRFMASTFAPLPDSIFYRWKEITGQNILEYYGMAETGFVLGNHLLENCADDSYLPGTVGTPLEGITVRLGAAEGKKVLESSTAKFSVETENQFGKEFSKYDSPVLHSIIGKLEISGNAVFRQYMPSEESNTTTNDFFESDDIFSYQNGNFKFLGRNNDVITVGGYIIHSSDIKKVFITHPNIKDVTIFGIPNKIWGQCLGIVCILNKDVQVDSIKKYCSGQLPVYKQPIMYKKIFQQ